MKYLFFPILVFLLLVSCDDSTTNSNNSSNNVLQLNSVVIEGNDLRKSAVLNQVDSVKIDNARLLIRNIKFKTFDDEDSLEFKSAPQVVALNLDGTANSIGVADIPVGTYNRADFRIHKLDPDDPDDQPYVELAEFAEFMVDKRYSVLVDGKYFFNGNETTFQFKSRLNEKQKHFLNPNIVVPGESDTVNVSLVVYISGWFLNENGSLLDPSDGNNENEISKNIKDSIKLIKDKDKNGHSDD